MPMTGVSEKNKRCRPGRSRRDLQSHQTYTRSRDRSQHKRDCGMLTSGGGFCMGLLSYTTQAPQVIPHIQPMPSFRLHWRPSHQWTQSGLYSATLSSTHAQSFALVTELGMSINTSNSSYGTCSLPEGSGTPCCFSPPYLWRLVVRPSEPDGHRNFSSAGTVRVA